MKTIQLPERLHRVQSVQMPKRNRDFNAWIEKVYDHVKKSKY
jgi:hypothetical protein